MTIIATAVGPEPKQTAEWVAPDCHGLNFYDIDPAFSGLLGHYMGPGLEAHMAPHLKRLGGIAGGRLDDLARTADRHEPILHARDRRGKDADWIEYHPAYREMEKIAFDDFGLHAMSHRGGVLGSADPLPPLAKYAVKYLYVQGEFGLMCPISLCDTSAFMVGRYAEGEVRKRYFNRMIAPSREEMWTGTQFMTEQAGGSDVANLETEARFEDGKWRIYGDKWFCSHADSDVLLILVRTPGAAAGSRGLSLFLVPRSREDGTRNNYRILRLKPKMGTRSMATGEITFEGAEAHLLGEEGRGLRQTMDQVSLSRLSHGVRAAALMRRCLNEAIVVAQHRYAFGKPLIEQPLMRRQLMKMMLPTEQALSAFLYSAKIMEQANRGDGRAETLLRILTPLIKFRACRDNIPVATAAMEVRGGNGFIEDWVNPRLVRDAHTGVLWEGTSSIVALDVATRAVAKIRAHETLGEAMHEIVEATDSLPGQFRGELDGLIDRAVSYADEVAKNSAGEIYARQATNGLYHAVTSVLLAEEGTILAKSNGNASRALLSRLVMKHRLQSPDPLSMADAGLESKAMEILFEAGRSDLDTVTAALAA